VDLQEKKQGQVLWARVCMGCVCGEGLGGRHEQLLLAVQEHQAVPAEEGRQVGL
jgi:hypothetical protein